MLRNIPNRVDQAMLKNLLDITSFGRYDFMYLRIGQSLVFLILPVTQADDTPIDFANNCNVGYAFINFIDAQSIIPFVLARAGKRWNCFASDKVAEVSYASEFSLLVYCRYSSSPQPSKVKIALSRNFVIHQSCSNTPISVQRQVKSFCALILG